MKKNILIVLITIIIFMVFAECMAKFMHHKFFINDSQDKGKINILIIGDSQSHFFPEILQSKLPAACRMIKESESGTGPHHYLAKLKLLTRNHRAKVVVIPFCVTNDAINLLSFLKNPYLKKIKLFLAERSYLYHLFRKSYSYLRYKKFPRVKADIKRNRLNALNPYLSKLAKEYPDLMKNNLFIRGDDFAGAWIEFEGIIRAMSVYAKSKGLVLVLTEVPDCSQVHAHHKEFYRSLGFNTWAKDENIDYFQNRLKNIAAENDILFMEVLPDFRRHNEDLLYYDNDVHMNQEGNKLFAKLLFRFLKNNNLVQ